MLDDFGSIRGHIIIQRGRIFRKMSEDDIQQDFNFQWCYWGSPEAHCVQQAKKDVEEMGATIANYLVYDYEVLPTINNEKM